MTKSPKPTRGKTPGAIPGGNAEDDRPRVGLFQPRPDGVERYVQVYRVSPRTQRPVLLYRAPVDVLEDQILEWSGGGKYRLQLMEQNANGAFEYAEQRTLEIDAPERVPPPELTQPKAKAAGSGPAASGATPGVVVGGTPMADLLDAFKQTLDMQRQAMEGLKSKTDWAAILAPFAPAVVALVTGLLSRPSGPDALTVVEKVGAILKGQMGPAASFRDQLETMNEFLDLKERAASASDGGDPIMQIVADNLPKFLDVLNRERAVKGQPPVTAEQLTSRLNPPGTAPAALPRPAVPTPAAGEPLAVEPWRQYVRAQRRQLVAWAQADKDPAIVAAFLWEMLPAAFRGLLKTFVARADAVALLVGELPEVAPFTEWVTLLVEALYAESHPEQYAEDGDGTGSEAPGAAPEGGTDAEA